MAGQNKEGAESMKRYKIMIIEDDPVIQGELQTLLNGNGYATIGIKDFSAVIEQIQDEKPHLILLDIKLPGENGFALCSKRHPILKESISKEASAKATAFSLYFILRRSEHFN